MRATVSEQLALCTSSGGHAGLVWTVPGTLTLCVRGVVLSTCVRAHVPSPPSLQGLFPRLGRVMVETSVVFTCYGKATGSRAPRRVASCNDLLLPFADQISRVVDSWLL